MKYVFYLIAHMAYAHLSLSVIIMSSNPLLQCPWLNLFGTKICYFDNKTVSPYDIAALLILECNEVTSQLPVCSSRKIWEILQ